MDDNLDNLKKEDFRPALVTCKSRDRRGIGSDRENEDVY